MSYGANSDTVQLHLGGELTDAPQNYEDYAYSNLELSSSHDRLS
jgi:hypothetical protein